MPRAPSRRRDLTLFVSPLGDDAFSGAHPQVNARRTDGPMATIAAALARLRELRAAQPRPLAARLVLRAGRHELRRTLVLRPRDGGASAARRKWFIDAPPLPLSIEAHEDERPVISGGRLLPAAREGRLPDGRAAWVVPLPSVRRTGRGFRQVFVNGRQALRPRLPAEGEYRIDRLLEPMSDEPWSGTTDRFIHAPGDLDDWHNLGDVELVAMHYWYVSRLRIASRDRRRRLVRLQTPSKGQLIDVHRGKRGAPYFVENVLEAIAEGQWYLDRPAGMLYYLPLPGEAIESTEMIVPALTQLLRVEGDVDRGRFVEAVHLRGLEFSHTEWPEALSKPGWGQAAAQIPAAVSFRGAVDLLVEQCRFRHLHTYALELRGGCRDGVVRGNDFGELGGGGVRVWHDPEPCRRITVCDNHIHHGGQDFLSAVGVLVGNCAAVQVVHNHIHHFRYTGISVGWTWGYSDAGRAFGNVIEHNHIHDIGLGMLSDLGGIYLLGQACGTRLRHNVIHDIVARGYGGWGIYPDEGSTDLLIEGNLVYDCNRSSFHQHYGRDNVVQNNIFAFAGEAQIAQTRGEEHRTFLFRRNIVVFDRGGVLDGNEHGGFMQGRYSPANVVFEGNLYYGYAGAPVSFLGRTLEQWQRLGFERGSIIADPGFADPAARVFALSPRSPAARLGFVPLDLSEVGPRAAHAFRG